MCPCKYARTDTVHVCTYVCTVLVLVQMFGCMINSVPIACVCLWEVYLSCVYMLVSIFVIVM